MGWNDEPLPAEQRSWNPWWLVGLLVIVAALLMAVTRSSRQPSAEIDTTQPIGPRHPAVGTVISQVSLQPLVNTETEVRSADLQGKVALINFWGTWCPPCQVEFPHIADLAKSLAKEPDFQFVSVSVTARGGDERQAKVPTDQFIKLGGYTFPVYIDQQAATRIHLIDATKIGGENFGYPATVVLDRQGTVRGFWVGYRPGWEQEIAAVVKAELQKK